MGECPRLFMKSLLVGIGRIVAIATTNRAVSRWHLSGFIKKASSSVRLYLGVAFVVAKATELVLLDLMEDDRFLIHQAECWESMVDYLNIVLQAPACFRQTLGEVLGLSPTDFKAHVLQSIVISI